METFGIGINMSEMWNFAHGAWRKIKQVWVSQSGNWVECKEVWTKDGGVWKKVFVKHFEFSDTVSSLDYNVFDTAKSTGNWDGIVPVIANIIVSSNIHSFDTGLLPYGSFVKLIINSGASISNKHGTAIQCRCESIIINNGVIDGDPAISGHLNISFQVNGTIFGGMV